MAHSLKEREERQEEASVLLRLRASQAEHGVVCVVGSQPLKLSWVSRRVLQRAWQAQFSVEEGTELMPCPTMTKHNSTPSFHAK